MWIIWERRLHLQITLLEFFNIYKQLHEGSQNIQWPRIYPKRRKGKFSRLLSSDKIILRDGQLEKSRHHNWWKPRSFFLFTTGPNLQNEDFIFFFADINHFTADFNVPFLSLEKHYSTSQMKTIHDSPDISNLLEHLGHTKEWRVLSKTFEIGLGTFRKTFCFCLFTFTELLHLRQLAPFLNKLLLRKEMQPFQKSLPGKSIGNFSFSLFVS